MGSFHSVQSKNERRRANRLSKPPISKPVLNSTPPSSPRPSVAVVAETSAWQNPRTGITTPISPTSHDYRAQRPRSFPSVSAQSEAPWSLVKGTRTSSIAIEETDELLFHPPAPNLYAPATPSRRASCRPSRQMLLRTATLHSYHHSKQPQPSEPVRSYSLHSLSTKATGTIHNQALEDATSSNTHFMVDNQGFSLMRRRSLLTRPGVATRRSTRSATQRIPPPINQENESQFGDTGYSHMYPQSPLTRVEDTVWMPSNTQFRPPTPTESEYTHLGNLKLGSLRVVNGSVSPCSSDRSRIDQATSPEVHDRSRIMEVAEDVSMQYCHGDVAHSQDAPTSRSAKKPSGSFLRIPPLSESRKYEDFPASPFSFERSPTTAPHYDRQLSLFPEETEDEGISILDEEDILNHQPLKFAAESSLAVRPARLHKKADSGYSSATSVRSLQDGRSRTSTDSQGSIRQASDYRRSTFGSTSKNDPCEVGNQLPMHRHLSLYDSRTNPVNEQNEWPQSTSTLCHEPQQIVYNGHIRSSSSSIPHTANHAMHQLQYCAQLRDSFPVTKHMPCSPVRRAEEENRHMNGLSKSVSEASIVQNSLSSKNDRASRSNRKSPARVWSQRPGIEAPPLPTSPLPQECEDQGRDNGKIFGLEQARGRSRSRSIEFQQSKISTLQAQKQPNFHLAKTPVML